MTCLNVNRVRFTFNGTLDKFGIVDGKDKIRVLDQPAVTTEHTVFCVMAAYAAAHCPNV